MRSPPSPFRSRRSAALLAAVLAAVVYANSLSNGFVFDDIPAIYNNPVVQDLSRLPEAVSSPYWNGPSGQGLGIWRPLTTATFAVEWALWGDDPTGYHSVNVLVHAAATGVGTLLLAELVPVGAAFVGGVLFAVHPVHVEAVANIVGVAELLSALLLFGACLIFLPRAREGASPGTVAVLTGLYALAFLTKEHAAVLPALFVLLDAWRDRLTVRDLPAYLKGRAFLFGAMVAAAAVILWLRLQVLGSVASPFPPLGAYLLDEIPRIWTLPLVWTHYVRLLFFPADLIPDYSPAVIDIQIGWNPLNVLGVFLVLGFLVLAWAAWRNRGGSLTAGLAGGGGEGGLADEDAVPVSALTLGVLWFAVALLPVANVFFLSGILLAERTLYTPSLGFSLAAGAGIWLLRERWPRAVPASAVVVVVLMVGRTWTATPAWADTMTLVNRLLERHPEAGRVQWMLADHVWEDQDDPDRALDIYRLAVGINGLSYPMMTEIVRHLLEMGAYDQAAALAGHTWREYPGYATAPRLQALALSRAGRYEELVDPGLAVLEAEPDNAVIHHLVAIGYRERGEWSAALRHRQSAIALGEGDRWQQWKWMAELQVRRGDTVAGLASLDSARVRTDVPGVRSLLDSLRSEWEADETASRPPARGGGGFPEVGGYEGAPAGGREGL